MTTFQTALDMTGRLTTAAAVHAFALAGNATLTIRSCKTGARYTYRIRKPDDDDRPTQNPVHFVGVMYGSDNESEFAYLGLIRNAPSGQRYEHGRKSKIASDDVREKAFDYLWSHVAARRLPDNLEVWHEGRCGRCGRKLTVPESVASGFGPECVKHVGGFMAEAA